MHKFLKKFALKKNIIKYLLLLIALQILNQCTEAIDFHPIYTTNSITDFNDINSATEYISEIVLGNRDAFPEFQTKSSGHHKSAQSFKHVNIKLLQPQIICLIPNTSEPVVSFVYPLDETYSFLFLKNISLPPNKA